MSFPQPPPQGCKSEVALLLWRIKQEYDSAESGLNGPAIVASHEAITARQERVGEYVEEVLDLVGPEQGLPLIAQAMTGKRDASRPVDSKLP